jgi:DNA-binding transcriptional LysR family regulator
MDWNDVRYFLALARLGSVRAAGKSLGTSHSTVVRRIETFESQLATRLFDRNRDGYTLTEAGRQMLPSAERIEREISALERGMVGQDERLEGVVALTFTDIHITRILMPALTALCTQYPGIELSINVDSRALDLSKREADIAIRGLVQSTQPPEHLLGINVAPITLASYVAIEHEHRLDPERNDTNPRWLSFDNRKVHEELIARSHYPHVPAWGSFSSMELLIQAAHEGLGLAMLPTYAGDSDPGLRRLTHPDLHHVANLWLLCHPDLRENARLKVVRSALIEAMKKHRSLFDGLGHSPE